MQRLCVINLHKFIGNSHCTFLGVSPNWNAMFQLFTNLPHVCIYYYGNLPVPAQLPTHTNTHQIHNTQIYGRPARQLAVHGRHERNDASAVPVCSLPMVGWVLKVNFVCVQLISIWCRVSCVVLASMSCAAAFFVCILIGGCDRPESSNIASRKLLCCDFLMFNKCLRFWLGPRQMPAYSASWKQTRIKQTPGRLLLQAQTCRVGHAKNMFD